MTLKERIIEESLELFRKQGIRHTTMDDIAKHIGISKRTIYENFDDKEHLLIDALNFAFIENKKFIEETFLKTENVLEAVVKIVKAGSEQHRKQFNLIEEIRKYYNNIYKDMLLCNESNKLKDMEHLVLTGINQGVFRHDINPEIIAYVFVKQSEGLLLQDESLDGFSRVDMFKNMVISFIRGLCTPKGMEILDNLDN